MNNHVLVISEKETFIVKAIEKNLRDVGINASFADTNVSIINERARNVNIFVLYMDESIKDAMKVLVYLRDTTAGKDKMLLLIGSEEEYKLVTRVIPKEELTAWFQRPFDMHSFVNEIRALTDLDAQEERKKSILIVDDDATFLRMVHSWLKDQYRVSIVASGMQALTWLAKNEADLILLDYEMPVNSGPHVLEMLRSETETNKIPVMFLTGKSDRESIRNVLALKPERYLLKSIGKEALMNELEQFFQSYVPQA
jgi:CheY-like chemotaxis protein